jgi:hypothetical protein
MNIAIEKPGECKKREKGLHFEEMVTLLFFIFILQVKFTLVQVLSQLASKKHKTTPRPINCVPVGTRADRVSKI